ncbi:hypothetical protein ACFL59_07015 [Planctomycetota bacterium]
MSSNAGPEASAFRRRLLYVIPAAALLALVGVALCVGPVPRLMAERQASRILDSEVRVGAVAFNPFTGRLTLESLEVTRTATGTGSAPGPLRADTVVATGAPWAFFGVDVHLDRCDVYGLRAGDVRDLRVVASSLAEHYDPPVDAPDGEEEEGTRLLVIDLLVVHDLRFAGPKLGDGDDPLVVEHATLAATGLSNRPWMHDKPVMVALTGTVGGVLEEGKLVVAGSVDLRGNSPPATEAQPIVVPPAFAPEALAAFEQAFAAKPTMTMRGSFNLSPGVGEESTVDLPEGVSPEDYVAELEKRSVPVRLMTSTVKADGLYGLLFTVRAPLSQADSHVLAEAVTKWRKLAAGAMEGLGDKASSVADAVEEKVGELADQAREALEGVEDKLEQLNVPETLEPIKRSAKELLDRAGDAIEEANE